ncbi:efflux pump periplasmic linker protein [Sphingobium sp. SYK-6]|uniref:efflux RND transporter periplasmic adaptor subunit n=1 Tax=Sphingobium sp. (strain NBRC 103272 / SYK-6) TaxID=627192 RepID=UPI0002276E88|nr:efflux RND transporter periplasmic adaptor subunit [Sphingobium sp. SYK-6]BAK65055.1 efflux pump periplasmic linker protein [Sphingobium sp. SYK-6]
MAITLSSALLVALSACGSGGKQQQPGAGGPGQKTVGFVVVQPQDVPLETVLAGRVNAYLTSEVRPQISGVILRRLFTEGALVRAGEPLYQIDPAPYRATAAEAQANLASAQASAQAARALAERYKPLVVIQAISEQDYTNAVAAAEQAEAAVAQRRAALETARINLRFTTVPAPISGRIGRSLVTPGGLATSNQATALAVINQLDPIFVDIQQSAGNLLALRRLLARGGASPSSADVRLLLEDGSEYEGVGRVQFSETLVDPATGTVTLRARFSNPDGLLLPGMFVRARFAQAVDRGAFLVPQAAVTRDGKGGARLFIAGRDNKAEARSVQAPRTLGANWVVTDGLKAGDRVIVQGTGDLRPGQDIRAVPADAPQPVAPARAGG